VPNLLVTATTRYDPKGLNKAKKHISSFDKSVKSLGKTFAGVFAAQKLLQFGTASVKAFIADDKAARMLANTLNNVGAAYAATNVENYIAKLQDATGVLDDYLRPALQILITATGDVAKSQDALALALDISASTGKDLSAVSTALAKGFQGNTKALSKMDGAVSKATLATGDMDKITGELTAKYKGSALTAAAGYSGQMDKLAKASANSKKIIGKGLLNAISLLSGQNGVSDTADAMERLATNTSDVIRGIAILVAKLKGIKISNAIISTLSDVVTMGPLGGLARLGQSNVKTGYGQQSPGDRNKAVIANAKLAKQKALELAALLAKNKAAAEELKLKKDQAALDELKKKFDLERIGILAALAQATDAETKARLQAMLAILDEDAAAIKLASQNLAKVMADKAIAEANAILGLGKFESATLLAAGGSSALSVAYARSIGDVNAALIAAAGVHPSALAAQESGVIGAASIAAQIAAAQATFTAGLTASSASGASRDKQIDALLAALATATAAANTKVVPVIKVVTDPTVIVTVVQDAIIDNGRAGNVLFPPGSLLSPI